ncbi:GDSL esterase/lipase At5g37690-like [Gastrolobium bilobum]|uniref:GDSL esterase/lipase At5g37690-like n=1 Tax=Gastrolobium bilobum TaxID=150636 RepID=UPI002AB26BB6|nr:GDSL esterase/lipase At5g37690-like [Gastrolobium bilobum]
MAKRLLHMLFIFLATFLAMVGSSLNMEPVVPAVYIFGDSTLDVGTNNFLPNSTSRADMKFYGIDFPFSKPTGRFSNGYNTADRIVNLLGYSESPPPFLYLVQNDTEHFNSEILKGVNFASGGSGLLHDTGKRPYTHVIPMGEQIQQFTTVHDNISQYLNGTGEDRINKSLFLISVGSNDILEFFLYNASNSNNITLELQDLLTSLMIIYQTHLESLINLGARKFAIISVPPLGCVPILRANASAPCVVEVNVVAKLFYVAAYGLLLNLSSEFPDMKYSLGNAFDITLTMIDNPAPFRLEDARSACCGNQTLVDGLPSGIPCSPDAELCEKRNRFLFWDQFHPTEYTSKLVALSLYSGGSEYVTPTNFSLLVQP